VIQRDRPLPPLKVIKPWSGPKPTLESDITLTCRVKSGVLEAYIRKVYGIRDFDVAKATGARGDMAPEYIVTGVLPPANNIRQQVENVRRGRENRRLWLILDMLCMDGFIPAGIYVVSIDVRETPLDEYLRIVNETHDNDDIRCRELRRVHGKDKEFKKRTRAIDIQLARILEGKKR